MMKIIRNILIVIAIILCMGGLFVYFMNRNDKVSNNENIKFIEKCSFKDIDEEWIYYMCVDYKKEDPQEKIFSATFGGINMKYTNLKDHYIEVIDENTNKIIDKLPTEYVSLANGEKTREETKKINLFLENQKFNKTITLNDLKNLNTQTIDKQILVDMYNEAYNSSPKSLGKYISNSFAGSKTSESKDGYSYQVVYIIDYGNISKLNIELIYDNDVYLSDLIKNNTATNLQKKMYNKIEQIEKKIKNENSFTSGVDNSNLFKLDNLNKILMDLEQNL